MLFTLRISRISVKIVKVEEGLQKLMSQVEEVCRVPRNCNSSVSSGSCLVFGSGLQSAVRHWCRGGQYSEGHRAGSCGGFG